VNKDDFIKSWRRNWTSLCIHRTSVPLWEKLVGWGTAAGMDSIILASNDNCAWIDIVSWFTPSQNIIVCNRQLQLNFFITCAWKMDICFDSRSCLPFSMVLDTIAAWANSQVDAAPFIPLKLLCACSCCTPVYVSIARYSKWKAVVSWATKKSWATQVTLELIKQLNAPIMLSSVTITVRRCGVVGSTLAFGSIGHGFQSEHRSFSHHSASAFSKLRSLAKCSLHDSVRRLLSWFTQLATSGEGKWSIAAYQW